MIRLSLLMKRACMYHGYQYQIAKQVGVSVGVISRFTKGEQIHCASLAKILRWCFEELEKEEAPK